MNRFSRPKAPVLVAVGAMVAAMLVAAFPSSAAPASTSRTDPRANSFGIQVVRFAPDVSPAAMRKAVADAGAEVLTDLSPLHAMAVVPKNASSFATTMKAQRGVRAVWVDRVNHTSAFDPDPLHDQDSFAGENAPGVLQWEDDRDGVRQAWDTTKGAGIKVAVIDSDSGFVQVLSKRRS